MHGMVATILGLLFIYEYCINWNVYKPGLTESYFFCCCCSCACCCCTCSCCYCVAVYSCCHFSIFFVSIVLCLVFSFCFCEVCFFGFEWVFVSLACFKSQFRVCSFCILRCNVLFLHILYVSNVLNKIYIIYVCMFRESWCEPAQLSIWKHKVKRKSNAMQCKTQNVNKNNLTGYLRISCD